MIHMAEKSPDDGRITYEQLFALNQLLQQCMDLLHQAEQLEQNTMLADREAEDMSKIADIADTVSESVNGRLSSAAEAHPDHHPSEEIAERFGPSE